MRFSSPTARPGGWLPYGPANTSIGLASLNVAVFLGIFVTGWSNSWLVSLLALSKRGACYVRGSASQYYPDIHSSAICNQVGDWNPGVFDGAWWQILTSAFTHVSISHLVFNMIALLVLGPQLEALLGRWRFLVVYFGSAITGSLLVLVLNTGGMTLGASGAIFGMMGALLVYVLLTKQNPSQIISWLVLNAVVTVLGASFISWQGHLGGFLGGLAFGFVLVMAAKRRYSRPNVRDTFGW